MEKAIMAILLSLIIAMGHSTWCRRRSCW